MRISRKLTVVTVVMAFALIGTWAYAQETPSKEPAKSKWEFEVIPYFWMAGVTGDVTVKGLTEHVSESFSDILHDLKFGAQGHLEARNDRWGLFFDATYLNLSTSDRVDRPIGPVKVEVGLEEWLVELGGLYQLARWPLGKEGGETALALDVLGGGRYWYLNTDLDVTGPVLGHQFGGSGSKQWIDPFVGLRARLNLTKDLLLVLRGDVGGFDVGSRISWNGQVALGYYISRVVSVWLGYRALYVDYQSGSGLNKFAYDMTMHGPQIGVGFRF